MSKYVFVWPRKQTILLEENHLINQNWGNNLWIQVPEVFFIHTSVRIALIVYSNVIFIFITYAYNAPWDVENFNVQNGDKRPTI